MPRLSLRVTIAALSASFVAIVAALTLSITLTTSLAALRSLGEKHAVALAHGVTLSVDETLTVPLTQLFVLRNYTGAIAGSTASLSSEDDEVDAAVRQSFISGTVAGRAMAQLSLVRPHRSTTFARTADPAYYAEVVLSAAAASSTVSRDRIVAYDGTTHRGVNATAATTSAFAPPSFAAFVSFANQSNAFAASPNASGLATSFAATRNLATSTVSPAIVASVPLPASSAGFVSLSIALEVLHTAFHAARARGIDRLGAMLDADHYVLASDDGESSSLRSTSRVVAATAPGAGGCRPAIAGDPFTAARLSAPHVACHTHVSESAFAVFRALSSEWLASTRAAGSPIVSQSVDAGSKYHVAAARLRFDRFEGLELIVVEAVPDGAVVGTVVRGRNVAVGASVAVFVAVATIAFVLISLLLSPLNRVAERMANAASLSDAAAQDDLSSMAEVAELQMAYYAMNAELNRIRSFLPQAILRGTSEEGVDDAAMAKQDTPEEDGDGQAALSVASWSPAATAASLQCYVERAVISVVSCGVVGFHGAATRTASTSAVVQASETLMRIVTGTLVERRGVLLAFHGDHIVATFNAARRCRDHASAAAAAALALADAVPSAADCFDLPVRIGVATGACLVGNLGTDSTKSFTAVGPAYAQACLLDRLTGLYGPRCCVLANRHNAAACDGRAAQALFVDVVELPAKGGVEKTAIAALLPLAADDGHQDRRQDESTTADARMRPGKDQSSSTSAEDIVLRNRVFLHVADNHIEEAFRALAVEQLDLQMVSGSSHSQSPPDVLSGETSTASPAAGGTPAMAESSLLLPSQSSPGVDNADAPLRRASAHSSAASGSVRSLTAISVRNDEGCPPLHTPEQADAPGAAPDRDATLARQRLAAVLGHHASALIRMPSDAQATDDLLAPLAERLGFVDVLPALLLDAMATGECAPTPLGDFYDRAFGRLSASYARQPNAKAAGPTFA